MEIGECGVAHVWSKYYENGFSKTSLNTLTLTPFYPNPALSIRYPRYSKGCSS